MSTAAMLSYYAARAAEYERVYQKPERQADLAALRAWLPPLFQGRQVLEVACGTGYWSQWLAPVVAGLVGIDAAEPTLAIARARLPDPKIRLVLADALSLPQDLGHFDAAFAGFWFSHLARSQQAPFLRSLGARLAPGARVVLIDNRYVEGSSTPISESDAQGNTYQRRQLGDGSTHRVLKNFPTPGELRALLRGVGSEVELLLLPHYWALHYQQC